MDTTFDGLLNRRVTIEQPAKGFRVAVDTILLAAAVPAGAGQRVLDLGCGAGGALLALACRVAGVRGTGLEIQPELAELCRRNIVLNGFQERLRFEEGDIAGWAPPEAFDHVMMNPPYHDEARHDVSANVVRRVAHASRAGDLAVWIARAAAALVPGGTVTIIHRADCLDAILAETERQVGAAEVVPVLPTAEAAAKRVIVRAAKGGPGPTRQAVPLVLHRKGGGYTEEAESILRHAEPLKFR